MRAGAEEALESWVHGLCGLSGSSLPVHARDAAKLRLLDALGCALGAFHEPSSITARAYAARGAAAAGAASVLGTADKLLPEFAAFAGSVMTRCLDANDTFVPGGGHPSDMIPALMAVAEARGGSGADLLLAIAAGYEAYHWLFRATRLRDGGWDHTLLTAFGCAAGASMLLSLAPDQIFHALSIAGTANHGLLVTRRGELSAWKTFAGPHAAGAGLTCAFLAQAGVQGPRRPFSGQGGVLEHLGAGEVEGPWPDLRAITSSHLKQFPCYYHAQGAVEVALGLYPLLQGERPESVDVWTYDDRELRSKAPQKWRPATRETADHSIPYIVAAVLLSGQFGPDMFDLARLDDASTLALMERTAIHVDDAFARDFPRIAPCRIAVETSAGRRLEAAVSQPRGHSSRPFTFDDAAAKFRWLAARSLSPGRVEALLQAVRSIDDAPDLSAIFRLALVPAT